MKVAWAAVAVLVIFALAGIIVTPLQVALVALAVHAVGNTGLLS